MCEDGDIGGNGIHRADGMHDYDQRPQNGPSNDPGSTFVAPHGGIGDRWPVKSRKGNRGTFARGGSTVKQNPYGQMPDGNDLPPSVSTRYRAKPNVTAAWQSRPYERTGKGMHIAAPHPGEGLVMYFQCGKSG